MVRDRRQTHRSSHCGLHWCESPEEETELICGNRMKISDVLGEGGANDCKEGGKNLAGGGGGDILYFD